MNNPQSKINHPLARQLGKLLLLFFLAALLQSCSSFDKPIFCISFHKIVQQGNFAPQTMLILPVSTYEGTEEVVISKFPLVDSSCFGDVQLVRGDNGKWGLRLMMDHRGQNLWRQASVENRSSRLAIVLDGFLVHIIMIKLMIF